MPLWQRRDMDLGFARRSHASRSGAADPAFDYRMLLASVSARQAVSPTAQAQAGIGRGNATNFVSGDRMPMSASFHAAVARDIATERKSL
jgi:hypothetical protein